MAAGERRLEDGHSVALFITCLADTLFPDIGRATLTVLERLGVDVAFPTAQTCCGQAHLNNGYRRDAVPLLRDFVERFEPFPAIVAPSGSCVGTVRHEYPRLAAEIGDPALSARVDSIAARTFELSEYLIDVLSVTEIDAEFPHAVAYHPTCHSLRMLRVGDRPTRLLASVRGLRLVDLPGAEECCGFGGTFAVKNAPTSTAMLDDKLDAVLRTDAEVLVASDSSCLMHMTGGLMRRGSPVRTMHLAEILASGGGR